MKKEDEVIVDNDEIEKGVKTEIKKKDESDDEPRLYHYAVVILIIVGIFFGMYFSFNLYSQYFGGDEVENVNGSTLYMYSHKIANVTYNLKFHSPVSDFESSNLITEPEKIDVLNTRELIFTFKEYNGSDNGKVTVTSGFLLSFFRNVYAFSFNPEENVKLFNESNCNTSNKSYKVVIFDPYSEREGVFYNETNGCITIESQTPERLIFVGEKFAYDILNGK